MEEESILDSSGYSILNFAYFLNCSRHFTCFTVYLHNNIGKKMKLSENIKFAITTGLLPWIPAFLLCKHSHVKAAAVILCVLLLISLISFSNKQAALKIKHTFDKIGGFLGKYIAIAVLFIGYIVAVLPTGFLMKAVKRDRLKLKKPNKATYWVDCEKQEHDYEYQF